MYTDDDLLAISKLNHFCYCKHRWAIGELKQEWADNYFTTYGHLEHQKTDNPFIKEKRNDIIISRALHVVSHNLGLFGVCDIVEFHRSNTGITLPKQKGLWQPYIIEYKEKKHHDNYHDIAQVVAQALCLEEELNTTISEVYLYYRKNKKKITISLTNDLRNRVCSDIERMHDYYKNKQIDPPKYSKKCNGCSLYDICNPKWTNTVSNYIKQTTHSTESDLLP